MEKELSEFKKKRGYYSFNSSRKKLKEKLVEYKGGKCEICGYNECIDALEFHHLDPSKKEYGICGGDYKSFEKVKKEVDKCILVCANCHREIHYKENLEKEEKRQDKEKEIMIKIMNNRERYINDFPIIKDSSKYLKFTEIFNDIKSNLPRKDIFKKYHINNRTFNNFLKENNISYSKGKRAVYHPTKDELIELLKEHSKSAIGRMFGVCCGSVIKWCEKYGI